MAKQDLILIETLCTHYAVEASFFDALDNIGLIEIETIEQTQFIHKDKIGDIEKVIRIHHELNVNLEGIDVVFNILKKVDELQSELNAVKNRLRLYEND
jgi:hypothetical protein